ncbi:MAG TPA: hypothetical protein VMU84_07680 [Thermoanaerobaculia bacterium]|nr:hypothetical protein [Thermoanaerobaculia bacterium]
MAAALQVTSSIARTYQLKLMASILIERDRRLLLADIGGDAFVARRIGTLIATIVICGAIYGAGLGSWHNSRLALYVSIKVPLLMLSTALITALFNWVAAALLGLPLRLRQTFALSLFPLAIATIVAASVTPAIWFLTTSLPPPSPTQRTLHNLLYLTHVLLIAAAGITGTSFLSRVLRDLCGGDANRSTRIHLLWILVYAFVGGEIAWILRPFVGSVYLPVVFLRDDAFRGNVYEFILTDILPHLLHNTLVGGGS